MVIRNLFWGCGGSKYLPLSKTTLVNISSPTPYGCMMLLHNSCLLLPTRMLWIKLISYIVAIELIDWPVGGIYRSLILDWLSNLASWWYRCIGFEPQGLKLSLVRLFYWAIANLFAYITSSIQYVGREIFVTRQTVPAQTHSNAN